MRRLFVEPSKRERRVVAVLTLAWFAASFGISVAVGDANAVGAVLYSPAVAAVAVEFGAVPGVTAALLATSLYSYARTHEQSAFASWEIVVRAVPLLLLGALVGWLGTRLRVAEEELIVVRLARQQATELNDNVVQQLALARYALARGDEHEATRLLEATLGEARRMISDLLGDAPVEPGDLRREHAAG